MVFFYGSVLLKSNHTYTSIIEEKFRPKQNVQINWGEADSSSLYPLIFYIDSNGIIKTKSEINNIIISGLAI